MCFGFWEWQQGGAHCYGYRCRNLKFSNGNTYNFLSQNVQHMQKAIRALKWYRLVMQMQKTVTFYDRCFAFVICKFHLCMILWIACRGFFLCMHKLSTFCDTCTISMYLKVFISAEFFAVGKGGYCYSKLSWP